MENQSRRRLTRSVVDSAKPAANEYVIRDAEIQGFGLRVRPSGSKSFVFVYRSPGGRKGKVRKVTIRAGNPAQARRAAKALAGQHHGGGDPADDKAVARKRAAAPTVEALLDRFVDDYALKELKPKTGAEYKRIVEKILKPRLGKLAVEVIGSPDVAEMYQAMRSTPTQAAAAVRVLSSAMSLAEDWGLRPNGTNPARIRLRGSRRRERLFSDAEVARLLKAIDDLEREGAIPKPVARGLRLLFASGCRAGEVTGLQWEGADEVTGRKWQGVDLVEGIMRWPDSKTGFLEKPITKEAKLLLQRAWRDRIVGVPWVCPSANSGQIRIETLEAGFERAMSHAEVPANENATLHLIRHWFASRTYTDKTIPLPIAMKIVGHSSVATAMRYAHVTRDEVKRAADGAAQQRARAIKAAATRGKVVRFAERVS